ncbi:MAG: signal peptidase I [Mariprofundaceae bacterium]|nr:signal peptidase I [Mariprofundaceae bacterium]
MEENQKPVWREWLESIIVIGLLAFVIRSFIVAPFKIPSSSMVPTLEVGDYLFVLRYSYGLRVPFTDLQFAASEAKHGDVVVFDYPEDRSKDYIKRIVGLPGDHIGYHGNRLSVNGHLMPLKKLAVRPYYLGDKSIQVSMEFEEQLFDVTHHVLRQSYTLRDGDWTVPEGHYMVLGDNRNNSRDSRFWGFVPQEYLVGKAAIVWWSWDHVKGEVRWDRLGTVLH